MSEENGDWLFERGASEGTGYVVAPESETHRGYDGVRANVCDTGGFNIEDAEGEVGCLGGGWDKGK